jgi:tetratricopeptide (TPR) repeat protein
MAATMRMSWLVAPVAVFGAVLAVMVALNGSSTAPPALSAGADIGRPSGDSLRDARAAVRAAPGSVDAYALLGDAYVARARSTGDPSLYARADRVLSTALRRDPRNVAALVGAGTLAGLRHDFREQLRLGAEASRAAPGLARPYTVIADAQIELGRYDDAARSIQRLVNLKPGLPAYARVSYYRELTGNPAGAVEAMRFAASAGGAPESLAYVQALTGNLELALGRPGAARDAYLTSLRTVPDYSDALEGLARVDAARGDAGAAAARLRRLVPDRPPARALAFLAELELAGGQPRAARRHLAAARAQFVRDRAGGGLPDAEAVLLEANHGSAIRAVRLGRSVWRAKPSIRSADALGWALTRAGRPRAGLVWARRALGTGSLDPMLRAHAGLAARRAGRAREARRNLRLARQGVAALTPALAASLERAQR